jgi:phage gp29-like protein
MLGYSSNWKYGTSLIEREPIFSEQDLDALEKEVKRNPEIEIGLNTYPEYTEPTEPLDTGIDVYHSRDEVLREKHFSTLERLERNSSVYAATNNFKLSVVEPQIISIAADKSYEAERAKYYLDYAISEMDGNLNDACYDISSAILPGYSVTEKIFKVSRIEKRLMANFKALKNKKPGLYAFHLDEFDNILSVVSLLLGNRSLPKEKFIIYSFLKKHGNPYGTALFGVIYPLYYAINELQKFMLIGSAKFANPSIVVTMPLGASDAVKEAVKLFAKKITQTSVGILPETVKAGILDTINKSRNPYLDLLRYFIAEIEKAVLLNDSTITQSDKYGTRAETKEKIAQGKLPLVRYMRRSLEETLKEQLIRPWARYNFTPEELPVNKLPILKFNDDDQGKRNSFISNIKELKGMGYMKDSDSAWVRETAFPNAPKDGKRTEVLNG